MDYLCAKFGDFTVTRFGFIARRDRQTDRQNHRGGSRPVTTEIKFTLLTSLTAHPYFCFIWSKFLCIIMRI